MDSQGPNEETTCPKCKRQTLTRPEICKGKFNIGNIGRWWQKCSRNTFAEDTPCDGYVWRDDIERVPFEAMGATSASPISSHSRCSGVLCIEKPEPKRNRASKECSNGNSCLSCCEAVQRLGGPRCRVSRHNQGQRESDAKPRSSSDNGSIADNQSGASPEKSPIKPKPKFPVNSRTSYAKPLSVEYMQLLDSQDRDLRETTEAVEEQRARERAAQDYIRVQWWKEDNSVPEHFRISLRRSKSSVAYFHPRDDPGLSQHLDLDSLPSFHVWDEELHTWVVTFRSSAPLRVRWGGTLYCKHVGVKQGSNMPPNAAPNSRISPLKRARGQSVGDIVDSSPATPPPRMRSATTKDEGSEEQPILVSESEDEVVGLLSLRLAPPMSSPSASNTQIASTSGQSELSKDKAPPGRSGWPLMYACDMAVGFDAMAKLSGSMPRSESFAKAFPGHQFKRSTFDDNRQRWNALSGRERGALVAAGRTNGGLWTQVPSVGSIRKDKRQPKLVNDVFFGSK